VKGKIQLLSHNLNKCHSHESVGGYSFEPNWGITSFFSCNYHVLNMCNVADTTFYKKPNIDCNNLKMEKTYLEKYLLSERFQQSLNHYVRNIDRRQAEMRSSVFWKNEMPPHHRGAQLAW
jgi:hypothetical protein